MTKAIVTASAPSAISTATPFATGTSPTVAEIPTPTTASTAAASSREIPTATPSGQSTPTVAPVHQETGAIQLRVTDAPINGVFSVVLTLQDIEVQRAGSGWSPVLKGPIKVDLVKIAGVEQVLGEALLEAGRYTDLRFQVADASVTIGREMKRATVPSGELKLIGTFEVEAGKATTVIIDFDTEASVNITGAGTVTVRPTAKLITRPPSAKLPAVEFPTVTLTGLIATVPQYATIDLSGVAGLVEQVYPGHVPRSIQLLTVLTKDDEAYLVIGLDTDIDRFITAGTVTGRRAPPLPALPSELDVFGRLILSNSVTLMEPEQVTPDQVNQAPEDYAFKRVVLDTTYALSSVRLKDAPPSLDHIGFGVASDKFGSQFRDDYLAIVDPYNTEAQIRVADLVGTVLFPTEGVRLLLGKLYRFIPDDVEEALSKPSVFYERLVDDEAQLVNIRDLVPTIEDRTPKLSRYHGEMVSIQGIALGGMVKTEDLPVPYIEYIPIHVTAKLIGVADLTGAMPIIGISSEDTSGEVFGFFRFDLSVVKFNDQAAYAFLINKQAVTLDPVGEVTRAEFGQRVKSALSDYVVTEFPRLQITEDLVLEQIDLLLPTHVENPIFITRHEDLRTGDYLRDVKFDGFLIDGRLLGLPADIVSKYGPKTLVVNTPAIDFEKGSPRLPVPRGLPR